MLRVALSLALPLLLSGCVVADVAETAVSVASIPVKVVAAGVDAATTSQAEADRKRGRELRQAEERAGKAAREADRRRIAQCKAAARGEPCPPPPPPPER